MTTGKSVVLSASAASPETLGKLLSKRPECDDTFSEYIADQTDIQHDDPANTKGKEKSKQRKRTAGMVMEEWLGYRDSYLQEMLRHDGRKGLQVEFSGPVNLTVKITETELNLTAKNRTASYS